MPLAYPTGTLAEHMACRTDAVAFDVSHLGTVRVEGGGSTDRLQRELSNDLRKVKPGRAQYTHLLDVTDGSVVDDIIVWWLGDDVFDVMPNASNTSRVRDAIGGDDTTESRAVIAVQGPQARRRLASVAPDAAAVPRFAVTRFSWHGVDCVAAGTGYTGEDGVECAVPRDAAPDFWQAVLATGVVPAGLGARDTLRLEAGFPLHGHELGPGITPLQAGLGWVVGWDKGDFRGRAALEREREDGPRRRLRGLVTEGRQPPRDGAPVLGGTTPIGVVTSGNFSPVLGRGIAMALLDTAANVNVGRDARHRRAGPSPRGGGGRHALRAARTGDRYGERDVVSGYTPHTDADVASMLDFLGLPSLDELFSVVPEALRLAGGLDLAAGQPEPDVFAHMEDLAAANRPCGRDLVCFAGAGAYDHEVPPVTRALASRSEFVTSYTPYQPEVAQGVLQAVFEFQTLVARLSGLAVSNASLYDGAASLVEAVNLAVGTTGRQDVWLSHGVNPTWREVLTTFSAGTGHVVHDIPLVGGTTDWAATAFDDYDEPAAIVVAYPNYLGCLEDLAEARARCDRNGALLIVAFDPVCAGILRSPGDWGADVVVGEGQALGMPLGFGGPYLGLFACSMDHVRRLPGRLVGETVDAEGRRAYVTTLRAREQDIRREKATSNVCTNQTLMAVTAAIQLGWLGTSGMAEVALRSARGARYCRDGLLTVPGVEPLTTAPVLREFGLRLPVDAAMAVERLADEGFLAGVALDPSYTGGRTDGLLVAVTERRTRAEIDAFVSTFEKAVR